VSVRRSTCRPRSPGRRPYLEASSPSRTARRRRPGRMDLPGNRSIKRIVGDVCEVFQKICRAGVGQRVHLDVVVQAGQLPHPPLAYHGTAWHCTRAGGRWDCTATEASPAAWLERCSRDMVDHHVQIVAVDGIPSWGLLLCSTRARTGDTDFDAQQGRTTEPRPMCRPWCQVSGLA